MKYIYVTWHYTTHGVAYLKHVLSAFYQKNQSNQLPKFILWKNLDKEDLQNITKNQKKGFVFDEVIYLTVPQKVTDMASNRKTYRTNVLQDPLVKDNEQLLELYKNLISEFSEQNLNQEIQFVQENYPDLLSAFQNQLWRNIQYYSIEEQIQWFKEQSDLKDIYKDKLNVIQLNIKNLREEKQIANELQIWVKNYLQEENQNIVINVSLGTSETQVVWHIFAEEGLLPESVRFIKTYDDEVNIPQGKRFKKFIIKEIPKNIITHVKKEFKIYTKPQSKTRALVNKQVETFLKTGFSILLIGERGTGKSRIASEAKERLKNFQNLIKGEIIEANCASFADDTMAESELFGYKKGAFTSANQDHDGLIQKAKNGILFLDEIHHLSKRVQAKLMKALQTNENNELSIRRVGDNQEIKVKDVRLIFATNKNIQELKELLLPDFYDRIVQHVVEIPPLRETREDIEKDWEEVWKYLKFPNNPPVPKEKEFINWLKTLPLYGNFRDLQKIAMYYNTFQQFDEDTKKMLNVKNALEYTQSEFKKYHSPLKVQENMLFNFDPQKTTKQMINQYLYELQKWAVEYFGSRKKAIEHFKKLGDSVTEKTFNNWKNGLAQK